MGKQSTYLAPASRKARAHEITPARLRCLQLPLALVIIHFKYLTRTKPYQLYSTTQGFRSECGERRNRLALVPFAGNLIPRPSWHQSGACQPCALFAGVWLMLLLMPVVLGMEGTLWMDW